MHYPLRPRGGASLEHIQLFNGTISQTQTESFCFYLFWSLGFWKWSFLICQDNLFFLSSGLLFFIQRLAAALCFMLLLKPLEHRQPSHLTKRKGNKLKSPIFLKLHQPQHTGQNVVVNMRNSSWREKRRLDWFEENLKVLQLSGESSLGKSLRTNKNTVKLWQLGSILSNYSHGSLSNCNVTKGE